MQPFCMLGMSIFFDRIAAGVRLHSSWCATAQHVLCARRTAVVR